nr:hypothetical protein [Geothrix alkalitolerans]
MEHLLDGLSSDIVDCIHYRKLFLAINNEIINFPDVFAQSNTFWHYTTRSLSDSSLNALCRVFDTEDSALSLPNLLTIITDNLHCFSEQDFRARLAKNPFVESLAESSRAPDSNQLASDIEACSTSNPLVQKLLIWRNNIFAHRGAKSTLKNFAILSSNEITWDEVVELSTMAIQIYNRYLSLFKAATWSTMLMGETDFISLLRFAQAGLDQHRHNIDNETAPYLNDAPPAHA